LQASALESLRPAQLAEQKQALAGSPAAGTDRHRGYDRLALALNPALRAKLVAIAIVAVGR